MGLLSLLGVGGTIAGMLGVGKGKDQTLEDLRTPEQKAAAAALQQLGTTGSYGDITLGQGYNGSLGNYDTSGSQNAYSQLQGLYSGSDLSTASNTLQQLTNLKFNPDDPSSGFADFSRALAKSGKQSSDALNRDAAITGSRFSTSAGANQAGLQADLANQRGQYLAQLYQNQQQNALSAAQGLGNLAGQKANIATSAATQANMVNAIKDQQAKDMYNEYKRQRDETLSRIDLLGTETNRNPYLGVSSIPGSASPFSGLANSVLSSLGTKIGNSAGSWLSGLFGGSRSGGNLATQVAGFGGGVKKYTMPSLSGLKF